MLVFNFIRDFKLFSMDAHEILGQMKFCSLKTQENKVLCLIIIMAKNSLKNRETQVKNGVIGSSSSIHSKHVVVGIDAN